MPQKTQKKENLPVKVDVDLSNGGTISYANEVIATIAGVAANEVDGVAGMSVTGGIGDIWSRNKNITKGVKVEVGSQEAAVDLYIIVEYGTPIQKVCAEVQENVRKALESLTGLHVVRVDVHVQGVSFEKEKKAVQSSIEAANNPVLAEPADAPKEEAPAAEEEKPAQEADPAPAFQEEADAVPAEAAPDAAPAQEAPLAEPAEEDPAEAAAEAENAQQVVEQVDILDAVEPDAPAAEAEPQEASAKPAVRRRRKKTDAPAAEIPAGDAPAAEAPKPVKKPGGRKRA